MSTIQNWLRKFRKSTQEGIESNVSFCSKIQLRKQTFLNINRLWIVELLLWGPHSRKKSQICRTTPNRKRGESWPTERASNRIRKRDLKVWWPQLQYSNNNKLAVLVVIKTRHHRYNSSQFKMFQIWCASKRVFPFWQQERILLEARPAILNSVKPREILDDKPKVQCIPRWQGSKF